MAEETIGERIARIGTPVEGTGRTVAREELTIPIYIEQGVVLHGFHQGVLSGKSNDGDVEFEVSCGAGLGGDYVMFRWKEGDKRNSACLYLRDVLKRWVAVFDPDAAEGLPEMQVEIEEER